MMRQIALLASVLGLPQCNNQTRNDSQDDERGCRHCDFVSFNKLDGAITESVLSRSNGTVSEIAANVVRELLDRSVAALRFFAHRVQHDVVQIATQDFGIWTLGFGASTASSNGRAGPRWFLFGDGARDLSGVSALDAVWPLPCQ